MNKAMIDKRHDDDVWRALARRSGGGDPPKLFNFNGEEHGFEISAIAYATSASALALPCAILRTVLIDSDEFRSMMMMCGMPSPADPVAETLQTDPAAIHDPPTHRPETAPVPSNRPARSSRGVTSEGELMPTAAAVSVKRCSSCNRKVGLTSFRCRPLQYEVEEVEMEAVNTPVTEVVKCVYNPAVRYVGYAKNLKRNLENLEKAATDLYDKRNEIQQLIRNNDGAGKIPSPRCETWLKRVEDIEKQMVEMKEKYEQEKKCFKGFCPNVYSRMMFGKHVVVKIAEVSKLVSTFTSYEGVLVDAPTESVERVSVARVEVDSSTARTIQKILEHIRDGHVQRIGIWGVGGVGKTTVMEMVNNLPEISQMFEVVIWVTVSRDWSIRKVDSPGREYVKMHDVIRDLAMRITSHGGGEGQIFWTRAGAKLEEFSPKEQGELKAANVISLMHNNLCRLPESVDCPVLTTLLLQGNNQLKAIPDSFLEGMPALQVLDLRGTIIKQLPPSSIGSTRSLSHPKLGHSSHWRCLPSRGSSIFPLRSEN
ncbi:Disease resistance protein RFL1 [Acorus calamus]|uniref:Disease resistance protein RFL1 n=1 Tax=Acorus calamus TaxID=4465 RepID=A0AAV9F332_ACOCL|nr:Disease resistance protein RFL1 [Acorus calamus]